MRRLIVALFILSACAFAQNPPANPPTTTTDPTGRSCTANSVLNYIPSGTLFSCDATKHYAQIAAGSAPPSGPAGGDLGGTYPNPSVVAAPPIQLQATALTASAPSVSAGTPGADTWTYKVVGWACGANGLNSSASAGTSVSAALPTMNNAVTVPSSPAGFLFYDIYLTAVGTSGHIGKIASRLSPGAIFHDITGVGDLPDLPQTVNNTLGACVGGSFYVSGYASLAGSAVARNASIPQDNGIRIPYFLAQGPVASSFGVGTSFTGDVEGPSVIRGMVGLDVETNITYTGSAPAQIKGTLQQGMFRTTVTPTIDGFIGADNDFYFLGNVNGASLLGYDMFAINDSTTQMAQLIGSQNYVLNGNFSAPPPTGTDSAVAMDLKIENVFASCGTCIGAKIVLSSGAATITNGTGVDIDFSDAETTSTATTLRGIHIGSPTGQFASIGSYNAIYQSGASDNSTLEGSLTLQSHTYAAWSLLTLPAGARVTVSDGQVTTVVANVVSNSTCKGGSAQAVPAIFDGSALKCAYLP